MTRKISLRTTTMLAVAAAMIAVSATPSLAGGKTCVQDGAGITEVCFEWSLVANPDENTDFGVDFTDASSPDLTIFTGNLGWIVSAEVVATGAPANIGAIKIDPTVSTDDFEVTISNSGLAGAANVGSIVLNAISWSGYSTVEGGRISGNLTGNLTLIEDSGGAGGELTFIVDGDVTSAATVTAPTIKSLFIKGDLAGDVNCDDILSGGTLTVLTDTRGDITVAGTLDGGMSLKQEVATTASITVVTMAGTIRTNETSGSYAGDLRLDNGLSSGSLIIDGQMTGTGSIDLTGDAVGL